MERRYESGVFFTGSKRKILATLLFLLPIFYVVEKLALYFAGYRAVGFGGLLSTLLYAQWKGFLGILPVALVFSYLLACLSEARFFAFDKRKAIAASLSCLPLLVLILGLNPFMYLICTSVGSLSACKSTISWDNFLFDLLLTISLSYFLACAIDIIIKKRES